MNNDSMIGGNIRSLREFYGETQQQLADALNVEHSAISNYENNIRTPDPAKLNAIAKHFSVSVEQLIHSDLSKIGKSNYDEMIYWKNIEKTFPIVASKAAYKNESFKKALIYHKALYRGIHHLEWDALHLINQFVGVYIDYIEKCLDYYIEAYKNEESKLEAAVNYIAIIFLVDSTIIASQNVKSNRPAILKLVTSKSRRIEQFFNIHNSESKDDSDITSFLDEQDIFNTIKTMLTELKHSKEYSDIADYYLALQYLNGLIDNGMPLELKTVVGNEMINSLIFVGNTYAIEKKNLNIRVVYGSSQNVDDK